MPAAQLTLNKSGTNKQHKPAVVSYEAGQAPAPYNGEKEDSEEAEEVKNGEKISRNIFKLYLYPFSLDLCNIKTTFGEGIF